MATEEALKCLTYLANGDMSANQYLWVAPGTGAPTPQMVLAAEASNAIGILQDKPAAAGRAGRVAIGGVSKAILGGTVTRGDKITCDSAGKTVTVGSADDYQLGIAQESGVANQVIAVLIDKRGLS